MDREIKEEQVIIEDNNDEYIEYIEENKQTSLQEIKEEQEISLVKKTFKEDFDYVRQNIKSIVDVGMDAMNNIARIARDSEHPRLYECLSEIITNNTENNAKLLEIYEKAANLENNDTEDNGEHNRRSRINNTLIVGVATTTDIQKLIENKLKGR